MTKPSRNSHQDSDLLEKFLKPTEPVNKTRFEKAALENHKKHLENSLLKQELELKETICTWVIITVSVYLITVFSLIVIATVVFPYRHLTANLSDNVLITLLTTTTVSLIGLPTLIIKSLFPSKKKSTRKI